MNRFVRSEAYVKARAFSGALFLLLGVVVIVRTVMLVGFGLPSLAPLVMGGALAALGALRLRDYLRLRSRRA